MTTRTLTGRLYAGLIALSMTMVFSCGLTGVLYPRVYMPEDPIIGLFIICYSLPMSIMCWRAAIWWKAESS